MPGGAGPASVVNWMQRRRRSSCKIISMLIAHLRKSRDSRRNTHTGNRMKKRATRTLIFLVTLLIFFGGLSAAGYYFLTRPSAGPVEGGVTLSAPTNIQDFGVSLYLDFRRAELNLPAS